MAEPAGNRRRFVLAITISRYTNARSLPGVERDADTIRETLTMFADGGVFQYDHVFDGNASRDEILAALTSLKDQVGETDQLVAYFAGHGWRQHTDDDKAWEYYLLPCDAAFSADGQVTGGISTQELVTALKEINAGERVVIIDCCHSGGLAGFMWDSERLNEMLAGWSSAVIMASTVARRTEADPLAGGFFTQALCNAFRGETVQPGPDGRITAQRAWDTAAAEAKARAGPNRDQTAVSVSVGSPIIVTRVRPAAVATAGPLPSDLASFTGREPEVERILAAVKSNHSQVAISAVRGMGGIGKTTLAVHIAHQLKDEFPAGQIVVDMQGTADIPPSAASALNAAIRAIKPESGQLPEDESQLASAYNKLLHGRRVLVILDNAGSDAQCRPLQPPPPCGMVITSRKLIALTGVQTVDLDTLPPDESRELLRKIVGDRGTDEELDGIAEQVGCLPLGLEVAGAFLNAHPSWTVTEYLAELQNEKTKLPRLVHDDLDVAASLRLSARKLDEETLPRWQMLSVFPADFDREAAAAVWDVDQSTTRDTLSTLVTQSLLDFDGRYRLHDLMRDVAHQSLAETPSAQTILDELLATAALRHSGHFLQVLNSTWPLYDNCGEGILEALSLFDREWPNIQSGQTWVATHAATNDAATKLCNEYPGRAMDILDLRLTPRTTITWLKAALAAARRRNDREAEGRHLGNIGVRYNQLGAYQTALDYCQQQLVIEDELNNRRGKANVLNNLGNAYRELGRYEEAIQHLNQSLPLKRKLGDRAGEARTLGNIGIVYSQLGNYLKAIEHFQQTLDIARKIGDRLAESQALGNLGIAYRLYGDPEKALETHQQAIKIDRKLGSRREEGMRLWNTAVTLNDLDRRAEAITLAEAALEIYEEFEHPDEPIVRRHLALWRAEGPNASPPDNA